MLPNMNRVVLKSTLLLKSQNNYNLFLYSGSTNVENPNGSWMSNPCPRRISR